MTRTIRTLLFSTLYPSGVRPGHGIFVETRLRELLKSGRIETRVIAPVPWFFSKNPRFGDYARMAQIAEREMHNGIDVLHPRYFLLPKVGMTMAPFAMALGAVPAVRKLLREGFDFDLIDAHYYYPDCVAAALLAKWFRKPLVATARGTDVNLISRYPVPRRLIRWTAAQANASVCVSHALSKVLAGIADESARIEVFTNGVDLARFQPQAPASARQALDWPDVPTLLSVGNLVENKGHHIAIELLADLPGFRLVVVGAGPEMPRLQALSANLGVAGRVTFAGGVSQESLSTYYSASNMLILASSREGWPNVLLESMACGTPVIASNVGGVPEIVRSPEAGRISAERSASGFLREVRDLLANYPDRAAVRKYAEMFGWEATTLAQLSLFANVLKDEI